MSGSVVAAFRGPLRAQMTRFCAVAFGSGGVRAVHGREGIQGSAGEDPEREEHDQRT
jgi:hypothetical protein